jgi:hypothetical protein
MGLLTLFCQTGKENFGVERWYPVGAPMNRLRVLAMRVVDFL